MMMMMLCFALVVLSLRCCSCDLFFPCSTALVYFLHVIVIPSAFSLSDDFRQKIILKGTTGGPPLWMLIQVVEILFFN